VKLQLNYGKMHSTKVLEDTTDKDSAFKKLGIQPEDLSLAFIYWDFIREYKKEKVGIHTCRVLLMANPNKENEYVRVWISQKYLGPMQVHWYSMLDRKPYQTLKFDSFSEKNDVWVPKRITIANKNGRLQIKFKKIDAKFSTEIPKDLFTFKKKP